jgi:hypothetical protein
VEDTYHKNDSILESERLFRILTKLNTIRSEAYMRGESEQFILGIIASTEVIRTEINGVPLRKNQSILPTE